MPFQIIRKQFYLDERLGALPKPIDDNQPLLSSAQADRRVRHSFLKGVNRRDNFSFSSLATLAASRASIKRSYTRTNFDSMVSLHQK